MITAKAQWSAKRQPDLVVIPQSEIVKFEM